MGVGALVDVLPASVLAAPVQNGQLVMVTTFNGTTTTTPVTLTAAPPGQGPSARG